MFLIFDNVNAIVTNELQLGKRCKISRDCIIRAYDVIVGQELWCNENVDIGGGGWKKKTARLLIGDYVHIGKNAVINVCESINIGNKTGIGMDSMILTHSSGNGQSILEGYKHIEKKVFIGSHVSVYSRVIISPGSCVEDGVTIGAAAFVQKHLDKGCLYAGCPAVKIKEIIGLSLEERYFEIKNILIREIGHRANLIFEDELYKLKSESRDVVILCNYVKNDLISFLREKQLEPENVILISLLKNDLMIPVATHFSLQEEIVNGKVSNTTELIRDTFRRYGIILECNEYVPFKLSGSKFKKLGIEL
jgi:acetyltransferase-like isoleucine patch superfamily enzyme